jgi:formyltetrahydrofolate synthetase
MLSDLEIAQAAELKSIEEIAAKLGIERCDLDLHGDTKAKVKLDVIGKNALRPNARYIDVTAITPTPLGEGKTVTTVGLSQGLQTIGKNVCTCIRQPSQGPTFGIKGGAAGGGYSQVVPMEDFNLHLTGDIHAVGSAHNLLAAAIDARILHESNLDRKKLKARGLKRLNIDAYTVMWNRVVDVCDRALRKVIVGLGDATDGWPRETGFDITVASEVMAILALARDLKDLRERIGRIVFAFDRDGQPLTAEDIGCAGAMTVLMQDALKPTLMQTLEHSPAFVHAGPFANIAHGNSSIIADDMALRLADYVVTESGFGADCGMEKFFNIKCRQSGLRPHCVVMVATIRALKMHGGGPKVSPGRRLHRAYTEENLGLLRKGVCNLQKHIENARKFGVNVVVAVNRFEGDTDAEIEVVKEAGLVAGAASAHESTVWARGGEGAAELAEAVVAACEKPSSFKLLYADDAPVKTKIETVAREIYGAAAVKYSFEADKKIKRFEDLGWARFPVCMAKTHLSLSDDPQLKGAPTGWTLQVRDIRASVGAGFLYPICGEMRTMPGLPVTPAFQSIDIDDNGKVVGLF